MRIAIDGRKLRDYGIGTYVRNLLRQLAQQDTTTDYVVFCRAIDCDSIEELGPRFRAVIETAGAYSIAEQFALRWRSGVKGPSSFMRRTTSFRR
jgi:hypothetical protein